VKSLDICGFPPPRNVLNMTFRAALPPYLKAMG
jgi:hypothetical protein